MLAVYFFQRVVFLSANWNIFEATSQAELLNAFFQGFRFDLSFLLLWNIPFVFLWCIPWGWLGDRTLLAKRLALSIFLILNFPPLLLNFVDTAYFPLSGRRSSLAVFFMWNDFVQQWEQLAANYWMVPVGTLLCFAVIFALLWRWLHVSRGGTCLPWWGLFSRFVVFVLLLVVGIRGSFAVKPLGTWDAYRLPNANLGALALNTPFVGLKTDLGARVSRLSHFSSDEEARAVLRGEEFRGDSRFPPRRANVLIFVLESFSLEFFGFGKSSKTYAPFLKGLSEKSFYAEMAFANARSSIQALPSVLMGVPPLLEEPFVRSIYNGTRVNGIASVLKEYGYSSAFFHGARNGSMYIDTAAKMAGFEKFFGLNEYPDKKRDWDGAWGIFDEPFLQFMGRTISGMAQPFVAGYFSLSSHNPYHIPKEYSGRFPKGEHPIHESIGYADEAVAQFMAYAEKQSWYKNSIFVFVADHAVDAVDKRFLTGVGRFRVPLVFFDPAGILPRGRTSKLVQQLDILPSVLDALGIPQRALKTTIPQFGVSVFDEESKRSVVISESGYRTLISENTVVRRDERAGEGFLVEAMNDDGLGTGGNSVQPDAAFRGEQKWKATMQLFQNGLETNSLVSSQAP
jgi:hypothetical protein